MYSIKHLWLHNCHSVSYPLPQLLHLNKKLPINKEAQKLKKGVDDKWGSKLKKKVLSVLCDSMHLCILISENKTPSMLVSGLANGTLLLEQENNGRDFILPFQPQTVRTLCIHSLNSHTMQRLPFQLLLFTNKENKHQND